MSTNEQSNAVSTEIPDTEENNDMHKHLSCNYIETIKGEEKFQSVLKYFWEDRRPAIITVILIALIAVIYFIASDAYKLTELLSSYFDKKQLLSTVIQLTTFFAILSIWYRTIRKEWRQKLNKYLSVSFTYKKNVRVHCRYAKLSGEADARGMAQSFVQVLNCGKKIHIAPSLQEIEETIKNDKNKNVNDDCCFLVNSGKPFLHYEVEIHLTKDIPLLCEEDEEKKIELKKNEYFQWDYPFTSGTRNIVDKNENP